MPVNVSSNMNLPVPAVGTTSGPDYATDIDSCLTIIDQHNHSNGSGVQITPAGININTSLAYNDNFATSLAGLTLNAQNSTPAISTIYQSGVDLYFVDALGNDIQITSNGGVAGSPGSISNLTSPASATYVSGSQTFVWQSGASIAANMDAGSLLLRNLSPNSTYAVTLQPPAALSSNYSLTLPSLPLVTSFLTLDSAGSIANGPAISNGITASNIANQTITATQIANQTITATQIANATITRTQIAAVGQQYSSSSGVYNVPSSSPGDVPGLSVTLTTSGKPVILLLVGSGDSSTCYLSLSSGSGNILFVRASTTIDVYNMAGNIALPPSSFQTVDAVAAGTYTYKIQAASNSPLFQFNNIRLLAYELV